MKIETLSENLTARAGLSRSFQAILVVSLLSNLLLAFAVAGFSQRAEKTILIPPEIHKSFWVDGEKIDPPYLEQMATYSVQLFATFTPASLPYQNSILLKLVDPKAYPDLSVATKQNELRVSGQNLTQVFHPVEIQLRAETNTAVLVGSQNRFVGDKPLGGAARKAYLAQFAQTNGRITIIALRETSLTNPFSDLTDDHIRQQDEQSSLPVTNSSPGATSPIDMPPPPPQAPDAEAQSQSLREGVIPEGNP
jgi:conjugal transfer pilus assembly protein TraE